MRGEKELCMQIPVSYLLDLRYVCRLLEGTLILMNEQLGGVPADLFTAHKVMERIVDGYKETYRFLDHSPETRLGSAQHDRGDSVNSPTNQGQPPRSV